MDTRLAAGRRVLPLPQPCRRTGLTDRILGFTMIGPEAGEVMAVVQTAMLAGLPYTGLRDAILAHPTMAEGLNALFSQLPPSSAH